MAGTVFSGERKLAKAGDGEDAPLGHRPWSLAGRD